MELLLLLPLLAGFAVFDFFGGESSSGAANDKADTPVPVEPEPEDLVVEGTGAAESLRSGPGDDFVLGAANADTLAGGQGDDILLGESGADWLYGGIGYDTMLGGAGNDTLFGLNGYDDMVGGDGNDSLVGGAGQDTLVGSSGADTLEGGSGNDLISGIDIRGSLTPLAVNFINTATGASADLAALKDDVTDTYGSAAPNALLDRLDAEYSAAATSDADDLLFGGKGNDTIIGDLSDTITGGIGNDALQVLSGGAGEAVVVNDFDPAQDTLNVFVAAGTNPAITYVNGATPADGVSVVVAGDTVAVLKGLVASGIPAGAVTITVAAV